MTARRDTTTRAALYLRVSLDATGEQLAVSRQREDCAKIAAERGWSVVGEYVDNSISASDRREARPGYDRLVTDYEAGTFDALICWDLDRLTRQPRQLEDWIDAAEERGLRLVTANGEADLSTDGGRMFARVKAAVARAEVDRKGARQRRALRQRAEQGRPPLGVRLTGYTSQGDIVPEEAAFVREAFARFAAGESLRGLTRWAADQGHTTRRGRPWSPSTFRDILRNPRYAGRVRYCGEDVRDGTWQPIVTPETFAVVQHRLSDPRRRTQQGTDRRYLGSGLYRCSECGAPMRGWSGRRYRCANGHHSRSGNDVDPFVARIIEERLAREDVAELLATDGSARAAELLAQAEQLRARLERTEADYDADLIDGRRYRTKVEKVTAELHAVERERASLLAGAGPAAVFAAPSPAEAFRSASLMIQRAVVDFLAVVVLHPAPRGSRTFNPTTVDVIWRTEPV